MRYLTIKREKKYAACLVKMKVYIEDPSSTELEINGVFCRKLGDIKNGEEKTFEIGENAARIFVIADKLSKNICCESYPIAPGTENVYLKGHNVFDPATGNSFLFDGNNDRYAADRRQKGKKKGLVILIVFAVIGMIAGFIIGYTGVLKNLFPPEEKTFKAKEMSIVLNDDFSETDEEGYTACYISDDVLVIALKEEKEYFDGFDSMSLGDYADLLFEVNGSKDGKLTEKDGLTYYLYEYNAESSSASYVYYTYLYKTEDAFWFVEFCVDKKTVSSEKSAAKYEEKIQGWAKSVKFGESGI